MSKIEFNLLHVRHAEITLRDTGKVTFSDPRTPYVVRIEKVSDGVEIRFFDTRKRWFPVVESKKLKGRDAEHPVGRALIIFEMMVENDEVMPATFPR